MTISDRLSEIEERAKNADSVACRIHMTTGKSISMSIPPQPYDTDMILVASLRDDIPKLVKALRTALAALDHDKQALTEIERNLNAEGEG